MHHYGGNPEALALCDKITEAAAANFNRDRVPANREPWALHSGRPGEWYTMAENLYRAYQLTGKSMYKEFADVWLYPAYWDKFAETADPKDAQGVHAYSHCNTFSSAALAYDVTGDAKYLRILKNFYDWMQKRQTYATGGYGPDERFVYSDGALGDSLEVYSASFECPCCSWAGFKLSKYLMMYTGEARYGDWIERLLYNGIGAALPIKDRGTHMYYMDYHLGSRPEVLFAQCVHVLLGYVFPKHRRVFEPRVFPRRQCAARQSLRALGGGVEGAGGRGQGGADDAVSRDRQQHSWRCRWSGRRRFALKLRVPGWSNGLTVKVNGQAQLADIKPGQWATVSREWRPGDTVEIAIPMPSAACRLTSSIPTASRSCAGRWSTVRRIRTSGCRTFLGAMTNWTS